MRTNRLRALGLLVMAFGGSGAAHADIVRLPGGELRGIIVNNTSSHLQIQIATPGPAISAGIGGLEINVLGQ